MNFDEEVASLINDQINLEFRASYIYLSMSAWFAGDNQALTGKWPITDKWTVYAILENSSYTILSSYVYSFIYTFLIYSKTQKLWNNKTFSFKI